MDDKAIPRLREALEKKAVDTEDGLYDCFCTPGRLSIQLPASSNLVDSNKARLGGIGTEPIIEE